MILRPIALAGALLMATTVPASAQEAQDEIVRLPGQGFTKPEARRARGTPDRLVAGGGRFLSFDTDGDGKITRDELAQRGVVLEDGPEGTKWRKVG